MRSVLRALQAAGYRLGQFVRACCGGVAEGEFEPALSVLPPQARRLFLRQAGQDQRHVLAVYNALIAAGHTSPALLQAALLHDVGKTAGGAPIIARGFIVLLRRVSPTLALRLGQGPQEGWRRPFVVLATHAEEGARLAAEAGCLPLAVSLIRRHEEGPPSLQTDEDRLLAALQAADGSS